MSNLDEERQRKIKRLTDDIFANQIKIGKLRAELEDPYLPDQMRQDAEQKKKLYAAQIEEFQARRAVLKQEA